MDASRYFDAMHNAMSTLHAGAQLLLTVRLQDTCGNDAYLEVKQLPGETEWPNARVGWGEDVIIRLH